MRTEGKHKFMPAFFRIKRNININIYTVKNKLEIL